jgi:cystathionine beta-lyase family protein involved in aluminum resistance
MIDSQVAIKKFEEDLDSQFKRLDEICFENHKKVLAAFREAKVVTEDFHSTTGYGHDDIGRNKLDKLFALTFGTEAALARVTFVSGTHAIACGIIANLDYEDELVFALVSPMTRLKTLLNISKTN